MRIVGGAWRGKRLEAPAGHATRPTAERTRQAVFDMLAHAAWGDRALLQGALVLDAFAGTGALGLEALSRGARTAVFMEQDRAALAVLRRNIAACDATSRARVFAVDTLRPPPGEAQGLVFLDPPYAHDLLNLSLHVLRESGWIGVDTIVVAETRKTMMPAGFGTILDERVHGAAKIIVWRGS